LKNKFQDYQNTCFSWF